MDVHVYIYKYLTEKKAVAILKKKKVAGWVYGNLCSDTLTQFVELKNITPVSILNIKKYNLSCLHAREYGYLNHVTDCKPRD